ncbi:kinase-like domain-containing protein [Xylariaceae sp. FL0016]|nr:kinase-like domain-containing protein [Xylariaceae sp. FL0016]
MLLVRKYTSVPIPTLYAMFQNPSTGANFIIMENVPGTPLNTCYAALDDVQKASIGSQLRQSLGELRSIPAPGFYGLPGRRPYLPGQSWIFKDQAGPFHSADEFLDTYFRAQFSSASDSSQADIKELQSQFRALSQSHNAPVFTHADLQAQNIILRDNGSICVIDWESAGFYPAYFEFFIYGTYTMATSGLEKDERDTILEYGDMVALILKVWSTYIESEGGP